MGTTRKTITVTEQQDQWIKAQIKRGGFTNDSEYIRDLIRRDQDSAKFQSLKEAIQEGLDSGASDRTVSQIMASVPHCILPCQERRDSDRACPAPQHGRHEACIAAGQRSMRDALTHLAHIQGVIDRLLTTSF